MAEVFPPYDPFVGGYRPGRTEREMGSKFVPRVTGGSNLRQGAEREPAGTLEDHRSGPLARRLERQPVLDVVGDGPELLASIDCMAAAGLEIDEAFPVTTFAQAVDELQQFGRIAFLNGFGQCLQFGDARAPCYRLGE